LAYGYCWLLRPDEFLNVVVQADYLADKYYERQVADVSQLHSGRQVTYA